MNNEQNTVIINNTELLVKDYSEQRVVTFKEIDLVHERPSGTASRNFKANRKHFIEGEDFFKVTPSDFQKDEIRPTKINNNGTILITESGYLMLVKSFTDDLAWKVQRELVNTYFKAKEHMKQNITINDCIKAATLIADCDKEHIPYVAAILRQGGFVIPDTGNEQPVEQTASKSRTNTDHRPKNTQTNKTIVPGFGTDVLCTYAEQLRDMGENRNGWIILPNNDFKEFCAERAIPANPFRKWLYENAYILGCTESKKGAIKYTFVYRFNGKHTRSLKFNSIQRNTAERRPL